MFSIEIKLDLKKDLKNWVDGCNKLSHGKNWKLGVSSEYQGIVEQLVRNNFEEAEKFMYPVLEGIYEEKKGLITNYKKHHTRKNQYPFTRSLSRYGGYDRFSSL